MIERHLRLQNLQSNRTIRPFDKVTRYNVLSSDRSRRKLKLGITLHKQVSQSTPHCSLVTLIVFTPLLAFSSYQFHSPFKTSLVYKSSPGCMFTLSLYAPLTWLRALISLSISLVSCVIIVFNRVIYNIVAALWRTGC